MITLVDNWKSEIRAKAAAKEKQLAADAANLIAKGYKTVY
jgi:hypothetical protein